VTNRRLSLGTITLRYGEIDRERALLIEGALHDPPSFQDEWNFSRAVLTAVGPYTRAWVDGLPRRIGPHTQDLPVAEFTVTPIACSSQAEWTPSQKTGRSDGDPLHFDRVDDGDLRSYGFDVRAGNGAMDIPQFHVWFGPAGSIYSSQGPVPRYRRWRMSPDTPFHWVVLADRFQPASGTHLDFEERNGEWIAQVDLEEGWGTILDLRAGDPEVFIERESPSENSSPKITISFNGAIGGAPIPGVRVLADGVECGVSDADGRVVVTTASRPSRLSLSCDGWQLSGLFGSLLFHCGDDAPYRGYVVWMTRN